MADQILKTVEKVEILTLQDNYIEMTATDNSAVVTRAIPLKDGFFRQPVLAEHGKVPVRDMKIFFSPLEREQITAAGLKLIESPSPVTLLDDTVLFLGEIPHETDFEKGFPIAHYQEDGQEKWGPIEDRYVHSNASER